jgi:hypothetical protein
MQELYENAIMEFLIVTVVLAFGLAVGGGRLMRSLLGGSQLLMAGVIFALLPLALIAAIMPKSSQGLAWLLLILIPAAIAWAVGTGIGASRYAPHARMGGS